MKKKNLIKRFIPYYKPHLKLFITDMLCAFIISVFNLFYPYLTKEIINVYGLTDRCRVYFSPVFGKIKPVEIAEFMKERKLNGVRLQLQLHKIIWNPDMRGV